MPTRLNITWKRVNVANVIPRIMCRSFQNRDVFPLE
jgi:hypothetical protein